MFVLLMLKQHVTKYTVQHWFESHDKEGTKITLSLSTTYDDVNHEMNLRSLEMLDEITHMVHL